MCAFTRFALTILKYEWLACENTRSVASSAAFSAMAAKCAGAYSLAALHLEGDAFEPAVVVHRLETVGNEGISSGMIHRTCSLNRHPLAHTTDHPKRPPTGSFCCVGTVSQQRVALSARTEGKGFGDCSYEEPSMLTASLTNRLSSSVGEVLHETSAIDQERCEPDFLRPLTACGGDSSRSFTYLEWVHENQARRMRSRSEWFLSPAIPSKSSSHAHERDVFTLASIPGPFTFTQENDKKDPEASGMASLIQRKQSKVGPRVERLSQSKKGRQLLERTGSGSSTKNNCSCSLSSSALPSSCGVRRRSWRVRSLKGNLLGLKTVRLFDEISLKMKKNEPMREEKI
ncbi:hypothetical protein ANCCAN_12459 [Ancylostoma caninum]|uniref:Uncharacterized protein n=1 Tax=Ancylostoma caninum TaxID=29170 RepID=A0A368GB40_ANCCA|nr:hypothetical protein ANCCAN_12459 [Ancylostoma caninum]